MAESHEIKEYKYYVFSSRDAEAPSAVVLFYGSEGYLGAAFFTQDDDVALDPAEKFPSGVYGMHYRYADFPVVIDMLRNESPVYLIYNGAANTRLSTTSEPVGEGEV